ncbi:MAG: hypothetical protein IK990_02470 [Ruminiclostridium sp.]|nr:hypothetical protein [Ruminiclostridium sp.]
MKKRITLLMALCIALCAAASCSGGTSEAQTTTTVAETTTTAATEAQTTTTTTAETTTAAPAEAEGTVLYEGSGVKITSTGFTTVEEYDGSKVLGLAFENTTGKEITVQAKLLSINGIMVNPYHLTIAQDGYVTMDGDFNIPPANDTDRRFLHLTSDAVVSERIPEVSEVSFFFEIIIGEDWENAIDTDRVTMNDPDSSYVQEYDDAGDVAYDKDGIKIVLQGTDYDESFWGPTVKLCAYNGSDKTISIRPTQSVIDGEEHDAYSTMEIAPGCYYFENMLFDGAGEMPPISTVTLSFEIREYDPWEEGTLLDSSESFMAEYEPIHIKTEEEKAAEAAEAKGWWTREGDFSDGENKLSITFQSTVDNWDENAWYANGVFGTNPCWGGNVQLTDEGLVGTVETTIVGEDWTSYESGDPIEVKLTEDGESGVLLTLGTGEEYHLVPVTE